MSVARMTKLVAEARAHSDPKTFLWEAISREARPLPLCDNDWQTLHTAFVISYDSHVNAPPRGSGEPYILHPVRAAIRMIRKQVVLQIYDLQSIVVELLHDCFEDAVEGGINPLLVRSRVSLFLGDSIAHDVFDLTKHKDLGETDGAYFTRLLQSTSYRPLWGRFKDRHDNIITLDGMPTERRWPKLVETREWFPKIHMRFKENIERAIDEGTLQDVEEVCAEKRDRKIRAWLRLPDHCLRSLMFILEIQNQRFRPPT